jgi:GxxExxY protein
MEYKEVTKTIIGCAYRVYNKMGFGFLESVYEKCLLIELRKAGLDTESRKPITVYYEGEIVGEFVADIIVNDAIIIELKSVRRIIKAHACPVKFMSMTAKRISLGKSNWSITLLLLENL